MDWNSLFSGFIGALVGAGITGYVVFKATRWQVKNTIELQMKWERTRITEQESFRQRSVVQNLLGELQDNLEIARNAHDYYSWALIPADMWITNRGEIWFLSPETQGLLRQIYMHVQRYITKAEDRRVAGDLGRGAWDSTMQEEVDYLVHNIPLAITQLENWLKDPT